MKRYPFPPLLLEGFRESNLDSCVISTLLPVSGDDRTFHGVNMIAACIDSPVFLRTT